MTQGQIGYVGRWALIPELCLYEENHPPKSGIYEIGRTADRVHVCIAWESLDSDRHSIEFGGPIDGSKQPTGTNPVTQVSFLHVDERTLDSSVFAGDTRIAYARRRASMDGDLLVTVQENRRPDGSTFRNYQVYRRADDTPMHNETTQRTR